MMRIQDKIIHRPDNSTLYEDSASLGHLLVKSLSEAGDKIMLICGLTGRKLSAFDLLTNSINYARAMTAAGIQPGDVVSIVSENSFEYAFIMFGSILLNCALAPINNSYGMSEMEHAMKLSKPKIIFVSAAMSKQVVNVAKSLSFVQKVVLINDVTSSDELTVTLRDFLNPKALNVVKFEPRAVDRSKTVCLIMCSSGTTGLPKGVQISQANIVVTIRHVSSSENSVLSKRNVGDGEVVVLGLLPLFHVFGAAVMICTMASASGCIVLLPKFEEKTFLRSIQDYRCTVLFAVPPLMVFLAKSEVVDSYNLNSLRLILCGAAPLSKELEISVIERLNNQNLIVKQGYGMSELTVGVLGQKEIIKHGSVGDVNAGVYAKVVDEDGKSLGPYESGELCFKGSVVMMGYIGDEKATRAMIDEDGWLHTGDVGYYDDDLQFFIVDRIKELIKWKAFQVAPAELEALLLTHPNVKDCGVIGKPDEVAGEVALAFVVRDESGLSEAEVLNYVADRVSYAKRLHGGVIFVDEIPKNPSGKILRRELREKLKTYLVKAKL